MLLSGLEYRNLWSDLNAPHSCLLTEIVSEVRDYSAEFFQMEKVNSPRNRQKGSDASEILCPIALRLHSINRVKQLSIYDCYVEAHKSTVNRHKFYELVYFRQKEVMLW